MNHFSRLPSCNLRSIPFSRLGLTEHTKRTCFQAGWCWVECRGNVIMPDVEQWGRHRGVQQLLMPTWQKSNENLVDIDDVIFTCTCQKSRCGNCKCKRAGENCLPFCRCLRNCNNQV